MTDIEDILANLDLDDDTAAALRAAAASAPSGLREAEKRAAKRATELEAENKALRQGLLGTQLKELGVTLSPSVLAIPDDLSPTSPDKVKEWALASGLIQPAGPDTPSAELKGHEAVEAAGVGQPGVPNATPADLIEKLKSGGPKEFWDTMNKMGRVDPDAAQQPVFS